MNPGVRNIAVTIVLALAAAAAGAWMSARYVVAQRDNRPSLHDVVHKDLNLSEAQTRRLDVIEEDYAARRKALEADLRLANRELALAIQKDHRQSPKVEAAIDHLHMAMGALQKATVAHVFAMRAVLTPDQAARFDAEVVAALTDGDR